VRAARGQASPTQRWSMRPSGRCSLAIERPRWTPATALTTITRLTSATSGAIWRRGGVRLLPRECTSQTRRGVVVRDGRCRSPSSRSAFPRCGDSSATARARWTVHHHDPRTRQRGCPRTQLRPRPAPLGGKSRLCRECVGGHIGQSAWPTCRYPDARHLCRRCDCGRLLGITLVPRLTHNALVDGVMSPFEHGFIRDGEFVDGHGWCAGGDLDEIVCAGEDSVLIVLGDRAEVLDQNGG
jgi:hypothetical protein